MSDGWVCLHRKILEWEWYDDANTFRLFVHCLLSANHKSAKWRSTEVKRGQFVSSRQKLSTALKLSEQQIRTALKKLEITGEITSEGTSQHTVFTVVNYDQYQNSNQQNNQQITSEITNDQPTDNQRITTNNNVTMKQRNKKEKRDTTIPENFEITDEMKSWAKGAGITIDLKSATDSWKDYSASKDKRFTDWVAAWRNGMKKAQQWADEKKPKIPVTEQRMAELVELAAKSESGVHVAEINGKIITIRSDGRVSGWQ